MGLFKRAADQGCPAAALILDDLWMAEEEAIHECISEEYERHDIDWDFPEEVYDEIVRSIIPSIGERWSRRASRLSAEHPDHATYELLLPKVYELGGERFSTDKRMAMLREHGYVRLMKDRMRRAL